MAVVYPLWSFWNATLSEKIYTYNKGGVYPTPEKVDLIIANFNDPSLPGYSEFRLTGVVPHLAPYLNPAVFADFINPSSYTGQGYPIELETYMTLVNDTHFEFTPVFQNLESLDPGEYYFIHFFRVDGKTTEGEWDYYLGSKEFYTRLIVTEVDYDYSTDNLLVNPFPENEVAFTLDNKAFEINSTNSATYFQFDALIKTYEFISEELSSVLIEQKIILFKEKSKIWLNKSIHKLMKRFKELNDNENQYRLASLEVTCTEYEIDTNTLIRTVTTPNINFAAGLKQETINVGFLDFNPLFNRVTKNSFVYLNVLLPDPNYEIRVFKNGFYSSTIVFSLPFNSIKTKKVTFENFNQGDVIEFKLWKIDDANLTMPTKTYIMLPEGDHSNMIVWENEFLLKSAIECTGSGVFGGDIEFSSYKSVENDVEVLNYISSTKEPKLNINTGWLIFDDIDTVESLMRSRRAWLIQPNKNISLRPIGKKLPSKDLNQELISFPLEFTINKSYDEETYSF